MVLNCIFAFCRLPLHLDSCFLCYMEAFQFAVVPFYILILLPVPLGSYLKNHCQTSVMEPVACMFCQSFCSFISYILVFNPCSLPDDDFHAWYMNSVRLPSFACGCLVFHQLQKSTIFIVISWHLCQKLIDHKYVGLFLDFSILSHQ